MQIQYFVKQQDFEHTAESTMGKAVKKGRMDNHLSYKVKKEG